ncbi:Queuosine salvage protein [Lamellibrachia satsuma]|nr:Queuosine salvage protein [Lamellibrachia satsuma]
MTPIGSWRFTGTPAQGGVVILGNETTPLALKPNSLLGEFRRRARVRQARLRSTGLQLVGSCLKGGTTSRSLDNRGVNRKVGVRMRRIIQIFARHVFVSCSSNICLPVKPPRAALLWRGQYQEMSQSAGGDDVLLPREAARWIAERSTDVKICEEGIKKTAQLIEDGITGPEPAISLGRWKQHQLNPKTTDTAAIDWIFLCDTLNFSFWTTPGAEKYSVNYGGQRWTGYWSLCAAINRALDEGIPITDPKYYSTLNKEKLAAIFRSDSASEMPLLKERLAALHEAGQVLVEKYDGSFVNMLSQCNQSAGTLLQMVVSEFPSYRDEADYMGKRGRIEENFMFIPVTKAELLFYQFVCEHNLAFAIGDHFTKLVKEMFPDSKIMQRFSCSRIKMAAVINRTVAPHASDPVIKLLQTQPFTLMVDKSNKQNDDKSCSIMTRVFNRLTNRVVNWFVDVPVCNIPTGENIFNIINKTLSSKMREEYWEYQMFAEVNIQEILKHISVWWLSLQKCMRHTLDQGPALKAYFSSHPDEEKPGRVKQCAKYYNCPNMKLLFFLDFFLDFSLTQQVQHYFFFRRVPSGYVALTSKFLQRFPFNSEILKAVPLLSPANRLDFRAAKVQSLVEKLVPGTSDEDLDTIIHQEWHDFQVAPDMPESVEVDMWWCQVMQLKDCGGQLRFGHLATFVTTLMILPYTQDLVEQLFMSLYKRAQILIADIWACCEGQGLGAFADIDTITMFADYRIPQVLVWLGALQYSDNLNEMLAKGTMFNSGDRLEVEIRGCSIWATELIVEEVRKSLTSKKLDRAVKANAVLVDHFLWDYRRDHAAETDHIPIHNIRCIYY